MNEWRLVWPEHSSSGEAWLLSEEPGNFSKTTRGRRKRRQHCGKIFLSIQTSGMSYPLQPLGVALNLFFILKELIWNGFPIRESTSVGSNSAHRSLIYFAVFQEVKKELNLCLIMSARKPLVTFVLALFMCSSRERWQTVWSARLSAAASAPGLESLLEQHPRVHG